MTSITQDQFLNRLTESFSEQFGKLPKVYQALEKLQGFHETDVDDFRKMLSVVSKAFTTEFVGSDERLQEAMKILQSELSQDDLDPMPAATVLIGAAARLADPFDRSLLLLDPVYVAELLAVPEVAQRVSLNWLAAEYIPSLYDFSAGDIENIFRQLPDTIFKPHFASFEDSLKNSINDFMRYPQSVAAMLKASPSSRIQGIRNAVVSALNSDPSEAYYWLIAHDALIAQSFSSLSEFRDYLARDYSSFPEAIQLISSLPKDNHLTALSWTLRCFPHGVSAKILSNQLTMSSFSCTLASLDVADLLPSLVRSNHAAVEFIMLRLRVIRPHQSLRLAEALSAARASSTTEPSCRLILNTALQSSHFSKHIYECFAPSRLSPLSDDYDPFPVLELADRLRTAAEPKTINFRDFGFPRWNDDIQFESPIIRRLSEESFVDFVQAGLSAEYLSQVVDLKTNHHVRDVLPFVDHLRSLTSDTELLQYVLSNISSLREVIPTFRSESQIKQLMSLTVNKASSIL